MVDLEISEWFFGRFPELAKGNRIFVCTWEEYRNMDLAKVRKVMNIPILIDGRNLFDPRTARNLGFEYISVGRP